MSKCLNNRELQTRSGSASAGLKKCKILDQMMSLRDTLARRKTESNLEAAYTLASLIDSYCPLFCSSFDKKTLLPSKSMSQ